MCYSDNLRSTFRGAKREKKTCEQRDWLWSFSLIVQCCDPIPVCLAHTLENFITRVS